MIGSLQGTVAHILADHILLNVNGVGYQLYLPARVMGGLVKGDELFVFVHTSVREDDISLFGFLDASDKTIFLELNKVSGVGAKTALAILGVMGAQEIIDAISFEDKASFTRVSGIGPKAATRIINDLKDKVAKLPGSPEVMKVGGAVEVKVGGGSNSGNQLLKDALSALENLGYQKAHIIDLVREITKEEDDLSAVITASLKKLAK